MVFVFGKGSLTMLLSLQGGSRHSTLISGGNKIREDVLSNVWRRWVTVGRREFGDLEIGPATSPS